MGNDEAARLEALRQYKILDTAPEEAFDDFTRIAALICETPIALISLIDEYRQWFKSKVGLDATETSREHAFCVHALVQPDEVFIVADTFVDSRFATNSLVTTAPHIRFYAGAALVTPEGHAIGTLCVIDRKPRRLSRKQLGVLQALSRQVIAQLELRRNLAERQRIDEALRESQQMLKLVMDNIPQFIFWKDRNCVYLGCNRNFAQAAGVGSSEDIVGKTDYDLPWNKEEATWYRECDRQVMETDTPKYHIVETQFQANGERSWVETNKVPLHNLEGNVVGILGTYEDITERKRAEEKLLHDALHDTLTGLPNRMLFIARLSQAMKHAKRLENYLFAVLFLDLNRFKVVNDSLGHV